MSTHLSIKLYSQNGLRIKQAEAAFHSVGARVLVADSQEEPHTGFEPGSAHVVMLDCGDTASPLALLERLSDDRRGYPRPAVFIVSEHSSACIPLQLLDAYGVTAMIELPVNWQRLAILLTMMYRPDLDVFARAAGISTEPGSAKRGGDVFQAAEQFARAGGRR